MRELAEVFVGRWQKLGPCHSVYSRISSGLFTNWQSKLGSEPVWNSPSHVLTYLWSPERRGQEGRERFEIIRAFQNTEGICTHEI